MTECLLLDHIQDHLHVVTTRAGQLIGTIATDIIMVGGEGAMNPVTVDLEATAIQGSRVINQGLQLVR